MRLWSIHPKYLDPQGLNALWRECKLALSVLKKVSRGQKCGYSNHPQLQRWDIVHLAKYTDGILTAAYCRNYIYNGLFLEEFIPEEVGGAHYDLLTVTKAQLEFETEHLKQKLKARSYTYYRKMEHIIRGEPHPIFKAIAGPIEPWEKLK